MAQKRTAVVLFQLGGPDSLDAIEPFLYNLFVDPDIIDFPGAFLARRLLARRIAASRSKPVGKHYAEIGGKSPINELTDLQAKGLEQALRANGIDARVLVAMRYWHPLTEEVIRELQRGSFDEIVLLPLYPQYSKATTFSSMNEWRRQCERLGFSNVPTRLLCCYPDHPKYISALVGNINQTLKRFAGIDPGDIDLVFSAHGVPVDFIKKGDPYKLHIEETVKQVLRHGGWSSPHITCYQSKVGPARWLEPSLTGVIRSLGSAGRKHLLVIPVAFVTEHIETLHEINIEAREEAQHLGIARFEMMPALNDHPEYIACLTDLVVKAMSSSELNQTCRLLWNSKPNEPKPALCPSFLSS
ncbi:MAG: ferrochelatase [Bacteroidota bacterium]